MKNEKKKKKEEKKRKKERRKRKKNKSFHDFFTQRQLGKSPLIPIKNFKKKTEGEITRAVEHLKTNKSPGMDGIYAEMIKNSLPQILPFLVVLFNRIFDSSEYPTAWTNAIIVPIHKSGDKNDPDNYRGISLLSILGKVFAHILNKRLSWWQEVNSQLVSWCFKPSQPQGITSGLAITTIIIMMMIMMFLSLMLGSALKGCRVQFSSK